MKIDRQKKAELAHSLQLGNSRASIPDYDELPIVGMAAIIAIHIRGLGELEYSQLKKVADYFFDIPAAIIDKPLRVLEEIGYVALVTAGKTIKKVIPSVPHFSSIYLGLGEYLDSQDLNEHEQATLAILHEVSNKPEKRDSLVNRLGMGAEVFDRCEAIAQEGGVLITKRAAGRIFSLAPCTSQTT